jgi:DNA mismatch repair ATPase MutS
MEVVVENTGEFNYTYKLKKGISTLKGGIKVLKDLGYPEEILKEVE